MLFPSLLLAIAQAATPVQPTDCATAMTRGTSTATAQVCLAEAEFAQAQSASRNTAPWRRHLEAAALLYKRALALPADEVVRKTVIERLLVIFDSPTLNNSTEMVTAFGELIALSPSEVDPLFRYAAYQEHQASLEGAEETLLSARRLQPDAVEPFRMLARFYARRASALHAGATSQDGREPTPPGAPDRDGVYQVGGAITPPRRMGNAVYPADASAAGIQGAVVAEIVVNESGVVTAARVLNSIPLLDDAALQAVKEWRYDPTIVNDRPVPVKMRVTVNFSQSR
jgi:TonB family protein